MYVLAVDGGASSTRALIGTVDGDLLGFGRAGPSNHLHGEAGLRRLREALTISIAEALSQSNIAPQAIEACWLGMTGIWENTQDHAIVTQITTEVVPCQRVAVGGDVHGALIGASSGQPGVIVYAGTGSVAYGIDEENRSVRVGGWGYIIDDLGGGYQIGRAALKAVFRASDGRGPDTSLHAALLKHFHAPSLAALRTLVYVNDGIDRPAVAQLARLVGQAAIVGDKVAIAILEDAARELALLADTTLKMLAPTATRPLPVYTSGGVFKAGPSLLEAFKTRLLSDYPDVEIRNPVFPPIIGSFIMALRLLSHPLGEAHLRRLKRAVKLMEIT